MKNKEFKELNIKMIELAEKVIYKFDRYSLQIKEDKKRKKNK